MTKTRIEPICPVSPHVGGLRETLRDRIEWFLQRAKRSEHSATEEVSVRVMKRTAPYDEERLGHQQWTARGELVREQGRFELDATDTEVWVEMQRTRRDLLPAIKGKHIDAATIELLEKARREHYVARDGGDDDRFEILETRSSSAAGDESWQMEISIPASARREQPVRGGALSDFDAEWRKPSTAEALAKYPLERVLEDTRLKMDQQTYAAAIKLAKEISGAKIVELGSNFWPVLPLSVLKIDPAAEYTTLDAHYNGLWVMEKLLEQEAPELLPRVHRHVLDFTDPMPLASDHFDLALAVAAFGPRHQPEDSCASATKEIHRVLKQGGLLVFNGASVT